MRYSLLFSFLFKISIIVCEDSYHGFKDLGNFFELANIEIKIGTCVLLCIMYVSMCV